MSSEWDAETYDEIADPQFRWGAGVVDRLELDGDETVLDAGCGSGRVTELLAHRLPGGRVVALDGSASMLETARRRLAPFGEQIKFVHADLQHPLPIAQPVDAVLSTATFHWVPDHDALFANLAAVLRPGGRLGAETFTGKVFASPELTRGRLRTAGFVDVGVWLHAEPTPFETLEDLEVFLRTVVLRDHVRSMIDEEAGAFAHAVAERLPRLELNIDARRS